jgi:hypothetical protein
MKDPEGLEERFVECLERMPLECGHCRGELPLAVYEEEAQDADKGREPNGCKPEHEC